MCPGTPHGTKVDDKGCPVAVTHLLLSNVHFEFDKSAIQPFYEAILDEVAKSLLKDENRTVELELRGHTDAIASEDYNYRLGQARADAVKTYLVNKGVAPARIVTKSYSELEPIAPNTKPDGSDNPEGRALNRRVEMVPTSPGAAGRTVEVKIVARDVMFAAGGADLTPDSRSYLDQLANAFSPEAVSGMRFTITGRASGANAAALSQQRADAVAAYLAGKGIARERMTVTGGGGSGNSASVRPTR
jgi:outer membrane protein OmpA-like peptidoglycan-associated protein